MEPYNHKEVAEKWSKRWQEMKLDSLRSEDLKSKKPFYNLMMFPYPSAEGLHVGNMYAFTGSDIYGRFKRMQGYAVLEPIGLDGFGIHSENYAFKVGRHPMDQAKISEKNFYNQLSKIGAMFDWDRTVETYDPSYYRWTQWLFIQMFKHGLAYRGRAEVNWCPSCKTVLADEQVVQKRLNPESVQGLTLTDSQDVCERCGNTVSKKLLEQWFFRITAYAGKLLGNITSLDWSGKVKVAQHNWIGKKEGINITYPVVDEKGTNIGEITCFTTRPDTNFGATFVVVAPEHPFVAKLLKVKSQKSNVKRVGSDSIKAPRNRETDLAVQIQQYVEVAKKKTAEVRIAEGRKKTGVFTGLYCVNQLNGYRMPLFVSDFVLMGFGTGAVVGVPGHDKRDYDFAIQFDIDIKRVVVGPDDDSSDISRADQVQEDEGTMINSEFLNGLDIHTATQTMMDHLEKNGWGKRVTTYHLRDWLISRQRYWGPPIPMIYCQTCAGEGKSWFTSKEGLKMSFPRKRESSFHTLDPRVHGDDKKSMAGWYPVPEGQLPVLLPYIDDYKPGDDGVAPLAKHKEFYETSCPGCGAKAVRETDVSDTFLDSSWYFLRYPSIRAENPKSQTSNPKQIQNTNVQNSKRNHLELGAWNLELPWDREITRHWLPVHMYTGGAEHSVLHLLYSRFVTMALHDWGLLDFEEPFAKFYAHGLVIKDGVKMSKSKGNVVNPDEYINLYGADALRLYLMFMGPFSEGGDFRDTAMEGMHRWVGRIWRMAMSAISFQQSPSGLGTRAVSQEIQRALHKLVKKVTDDIEKRRYNTAIASMMEFTQHQFLKKHGAGFTESQGGALDLDSLKTFILLLAPFAPYLAEEIWQRMNGDLTTRGAGGAPEGSRRDTAFLSTTTDNGEIKRNASIDGKERRDRTRKFDSVHRVSWPTFDPKLLVEDEVTMIIQVNGKVRETCHVSRVTCHDQAKIEQAARASEKVQKYLAGQSVKNVIFVPGKLINFVI